MPDDEIFTIKELAAYLKIAEKTAYRFVAEGKIPVLKWVAPGGFVKVRLKNGLNPEK